MGLLKYALPAFLAANSVFAADDCGSAGKTITIESQGDASKYSSCKILKGDVEISKSITGDVRLDGVQEIAGSLTVDGAVNLTSLSASSLSSIGDTMHLNSLTSMTTLEFAALTKVGSIKWAVLPMLQTLAFTKGVTEASNVAITNTGLTNLDGISLKTVGDLDVTENLSLETVNVNNLKNATGLINFAGNKQSLEIELPNLAGGRNMTFRNVSSVSVPSLELLSGQLGFWGNSFKSFIAPNLTETGDLVFDNNNKLTNISMNKLETVHGGFLIVRNDKLGSVDFPKLAKVTGAIDFSGKFDEADLPALKTVAGGFNMQSTGNFSCDTFNKLEGNAIRGKYECKAKTPNPTTKDGSSGSTTSGGQPSSSSSEGASAMNVANVPAMGLAAVFGALVQYAL
ncbi:hypothetical protein EYZ11_006069 [Aspergillus tanneri]|uniref:GPI-anchored cell wall organization protein Ecm33 n=1 Tax=Aspergillus tanneri TaxID=1220188 RepID=A0A4S3JGF1_9EURO|nr:uncharacterized protein ATNIH1004_005053 [Aspergillus tanneri]KAA8649158.1 hypothetical protein ATNIH1004_005053 [Aspergillus tanneri]THC94466.1 hypothetical protein EYZ11_006069 [Aspergillus tanneri]